MEIGQKQRDEKKKTVRQTKREGKKKYFRCVTQERAAPPERRGKKNREKYSGKWRCGGGVGRPRGRVQRSPHESVSAER